VRVLHKSNKHGLMIKKIDRMAYLYRTKDQTYWICSGDLDSEGSMELFKYEYNEIVNERNFLERPPVVVDKTNPILEAE